MTDNMKKNKHFLDNIYFKNYKTKDIKGRVLIGQDIACKINIQTFLSPNLTIHKQKLIRIAESLIYRRLSYPCMP